MPFQKSPEYYSKKALYLIKIKSLMDSPDFEYQYIDKCLFVTDLIKLEYWGVENYQILLEYEDIPYLGFWLEQSTVSLRPLMTIKELIERFQSIYEKEKFIVKNGIDCKEKFAGIYEDMMKIS